MDTRCSGCGCHLRLPRCRLKPKNFCSHACANAHQYLTNGAWRPEEDAILREWYRAEGSACRHRLAGRDVTSIGGRAARLGIRYIHGPNRTDDEWREGFWSYVNRTRPDECWPWTGNVNNHGYGTIRRNFGPGINRTLQAHAVALHLHTGEDVVGKYVLHRCGNRFCCNPAHLYVGDAAKNAADRDRHGRTTRGEQHHSAVLTEGLVMKMRQMAANGMRHADIAKKTGTAIHLVRRSVTGKTWKHLPGAVSGPASGSTLLNEAIVTEMRRLASAGHRQVDIARSLGIPKHQVRCAVLGITWKHLPGIVPGPGPGTGGPRKITRQEVAEARRMARAGRSLLEIANFLKGKVGEAAIRLAITGQTWKSVDAVEPPVALK